MSQLSSTNIIGRVSHFFTSNSSLSLLLLVVIVLFGIAAFLLTPKQYNPEITRPAFVVSLNYEGSDTAGAVERVVYELVEKIRTVPGVEDIVTQVDPGGEIETTVIFSVGYDTTEAKLDLRSQLSDHQYLAQGFIDVPTITEINPETIPVFQVVFGSSERTPAELRAEVVSLGRQLGVVEGVSGVSVHGGYTESVVVSLNPERLQETGVELTMVVQALQTSQVRQVFPGVTTKHQRLEFVLEPSVADVSEIGLIDISPGILLRDVATIYKGQAGNRSYVWHQDGQVSGEVVVLAVAKKEGVSAPQVTTAVREELETYLKAPEHQHLSYDVVADDGIKADTEVYGLTKNLLTSIGIVAVVLMLFLSTQASLIVLISIPATLLIVFSLGWLFGETINRITLFALILSLGLLVDSAIVVVENIYAHIKKWYQEGSVGTKAQVITKAVNEIGVGLLLSTVTSIIVFLPMGYITGMMGPYMGPIAFFVPVALLVSFLVAIVITPFIASYMITGENKQLQISVWFSNILERITVGYTKLLRSLLSSRVKQRWLLSVALVAFLVTLLLPLIGLVHFQMLPKADHDQIYVYIDAPVATSIEETRSLATEVVSIMLTNPYITSTQSFVAEPPVIDFNGMFKGAGSRDGDHQATIRVNFVPSDDRKYSSTELTKMLRELIKIELPERVSLVRFMEEPPGPPVQATMVAKVTTTNQPVRDSVATRLHAALPSVSGIEDLFIELDDPVSRTTYTLNKTIASKHGVNLATVSQTLALLSDPLPVGEYRGSNPEMTPIVLTLPTTARDTPSDVANLSVSGTDGVPVSLTSLLIATTTVRPSAVHLEGVMPITTVTAEVSDRPIVYVMIDVMRMLARGEVEGLSMESWSLFTMTVRDEITNVAAVIEWGGEWEMTLENFRDLGIAMAVALLLVYGVLVAQYKRFAIPAYILVTVPLGLVGILWGFFILEMVTGTFLTATALIGFIALIGLVVNNAIIYLEYVSGELTAGNSFLEALINAGQARLRPIVLTSLTTVLGSLTIATDPVWSGLAWAIIFGLSFSTVLTLIIYPTLLMFFTGRQHTNNT